MEGYIEESHKRCRSTEILAKVLVSTKILSGVEIKDMLEKNKELILTATPLMNRLYNFVSGSDF